MNIYNGEGAVLAVRDELAVSYEPQTLTAAQKQQARTNIGAGTGDGSGGSDDAAASAEAAKEYAEAANSSAQSASSSANRASEYASQAKNSASQASGYSGQASSYASNAKTYASNASTYAGNASSAASRASQSATAAAKAVPTVSSITLGTSWTAGSGAYTQVCTLDGISASTRVDLEPDADIIQQLAGDGVTALYIAVDDDGAATAYAVGAAPSVELTIQCTLWEVTT